MIGRTLSHYRILEKVGEGGMGEVYLAEDLKLRRRVALKLLPEEFTRDPLRKQRFILEARAAAAIEHPHIAAIYDVDEVEGRTFIVMEYVQGESLRDILFAEKLTLARALDLAVQIADALARVHERGVVHRDLKPENVLVSADGYPKIIDFGLAKLLEPLSAASGGDSGELETQFKTREGQVLGTCAYMSPEQARGDPIDARSDVFSFGVLLYEMLSGEAPFRRSSAVETLSAILRDVPPPVHVETGKAPPDLHRILQRALAKEPAERYQSIKDLARDLRLLRDRMRPRTVAFTWRLAVAGLGLAAFLSAGTWWMARRAVPDAVAREPLSVLVADFENRTGDSVFDGALEQALAIGLEGASFITCYARPQAHEQAAELDPAAGGKLDERLARLLSRSQGIKVAVLGGIEPSGTGYRLRARALDPVSSETLAEASLEVDSKAEVLRAADRLAAELRSELGDSEIEAARSMEGETFTTTSLEAMQSYGWAQELQHLGRYEEAMAEYRKAVAQDPDFGRAYAGLAVLLANRGEREQAERYFRLALSHIDRMSDREKFRTRGGYYLATLNPEKAIEDYTALVEQYPADTAGHANLALAYFYEGDMKRALEQGRRAVEIYPKSVPQRNNVALYAMYAGDFEAAASEARAVLELNPSFEKAFIALALSELATGKPDQAEATYRRLSTVSARGASFAAAGLSDVALHRGGLSEAGAVLEKGIEGDLANDNHAAAARKLASLAETERLRGRKREALAAAERAVAASRQVSVLYSAAMVFSRAGREDRALELASELGSRLQPVPRSYAKLVEGEVELGRGDPRAALVRFQEARRLSDSWLSRLHLGRAYLEAGAFPEAFSELELCLKRRGEAAAVFLDDVPSYHYLPPVYYYLGRAQEGLESAAAAESYRAFLAIKERAEETPLLSDARRRLGALIRGGPES